MSHRNQKAIAAVLALLRLTGGRLGVVGTIGVCTAAALVVLFVQPMLEGPADSSEQTVQTAPTNPSTGPQASGDARTAKRPTLSDESPANPPVADPTQIDPRDLSQVLSDVGRGAYRSPGGLRYTRGSFHGHRVKHLMAHAIDDPDRDGQHGVFDEDDPAELILLIDDIYAQAQAGKRTNTRREDERTIYTVNLGKRIGYVGGKSGNRRGKPIARHVRLVIEGDRLITAYPVIP